ncbi:multidrug resistance-associated protein 1-like isoform X1 [Clavelina lepadiformis]|uniref:multidrug resistance-associated protein 1-like isoform X1 n=2 Tax=Clavelina lepadiformis TaxID=159417 RepID=UPI004042E79F
MSQQWLYDYCNSTLWDPLLLNASFPSFTPCFQDTVLVWVPSAFLIVFSIYHFLYLRSSSKTPIKWSKLHISKVITTFSLLVLVMVQLFYRVYQTDQNAVTYTISSYVTPSIIAYVLGLSIVMLIYSRKKGQVSSGVLFLFWLLLLVCAIVPFTASIRSVSQTNSDAFEYVTTFIYFALIVIIFCLNVFAEPKYKPKEYCPESYASFLSKLFFNWFNPLILLGYKKTLESNDLWKLNEIDESKNVGPTLLQYWNEELGKSRKSMEKHPPHGYVNEAMEEHNSVEDEKSKLDYIHARYKPSLTKAFGKQFWKTFLFSVFFKLINDVIQFVSPILLSAMIDFTVDLSMPLWQGYVFAAAMYVVAIIKAVALQQYFQKCTVIGMRLRTALVSIIYEKALLLSNAARQESTVGEIVNLMSTDAQRLMDLMTYINIVWSGPLQIILALVFLWQVLGIAVLAGLAIMIIVIPINGVIIKNMRKISTENMKYKDKRIKLMNEILNGIKVLKLYAWEPSFEEQVLIIRKIELNLSRRMAYLKAISSFLWTCSPFIVSLTSFGVYLAIDPNNVLDSQTAFVSLSLFNILQFPLTMLPVVVTSIIQAQVSIKRITKYLLSSEINPDAVDRNPHTDDQVTIKKGTFSWDHSSDPVLNEISLAVKPGQLVAIVGHVGSGKSSLISALLGEMDKRNGYVGVKGSVAYVPQQAWIQNATLKENIIFGKSSVSGHNIVTTSFSKHHEPLDEVEFYEKIVKATALGPDLEILQAGDQTEIGEKGINLSGGQKQRVSLARAVFNDADVYFLDDPLSAVDSHIGKHIFEKVIGKRGLLKNKTRLLVTHGVQYLPHVDCIIVLEGGHISEVGTYDELMKRGEDFSKFLDEYATKQDDQEEEMEIVDDDDLSSVPSTSDDVSLEINNNNQVTDEIIKDDLRNSIRKRHSMRRSIRRNGTISKTKSEKFSKEMEKQKDSNKGGKLTEKETSQIGSVRFGVFFIYLKAMGLILCFIILAVEIFYQASKIGASMWLSDWSADADVLPLNESRAQTDVRLGVYGALGFCQALFIFMDALLMAMSCIHATKLIHINVLTNILRAPIRFFDTTPIGRIINRFSKDVYTLDELLPYSLRSWTGCMWNCVGIIVVIMYSTVEFGIVIVPIGILYLVAQRFYVRTSRQLKRLESVTRSPIYSHFSETLSGVSSIRAYQHQRRFILDSESKVDFNQRCYYPNIISNRWLAIRLDVIGNAIVFFAALFAVLSRGTISGGLAGLSLSYALQITSMLNWLVRQTSETEIHIVAVERLKEYADEEKEADWEIHETVPPSKWPMKGEIRFEKYSTRYREGLDLVLRNISCDIRPGEKVGIVGRTGAGKSSLTLALFRLIEPAGGRILIDDVDISTIGLHNLRRKLTIIPQDPVLFSGSLRMNLDPFDLYSDDEIWDSLHHAHLKDFVSELPDKLEHLCAEGGDNLSVGQRQLVCLARALLRKTKVLVLDEATAAVDLKTDDLIQQTIRTQFRECTVVTIAHRLNTIMDYDRIMVLDAGELKEFEAPAQLIKQQSIFYGMAKDAGLV